MPPTERFVIRSKIRHIPAFLCAIAVALGTVSAATADPGMVKAGRGAGAVVVVAGPGWDPAVTKGLSRLETLSDAVRHLTM